jgi:hypothetical protein
MSTEGGQMARNREHDRVLVKKLMDAGKGSRAIYRETGIPESTVRGHMKAIRQGREVTPQGHAASQPDDAPPVALGALLPPDDLIRLKALLKWWQQREERAEQPSEPPRDLIRWTVYVDRPHKEAIEAEANAERVSIATIINRALDAYFTERSTTSTPSTSTTSTS